MRRPVRSSSARSRRVDAAALEHGLLALGVAAAGAAAGATPDDTRRAAAQVWPAFALVAGLLLIGAEAHRAGLFARVGEGLARVAPDGRARYGAAVLLVAAVTAVLNLDTSVTFVTPVLVYAARSRGDDDAPVLYASVLVANASSLLLPGSNLTNLIVTGSGSGAAFLARSAAVTLVATVLTGLVVALATRPARGGSGGPTAARTRVAPLGATAVVVATVLMVVLRSPALAVAGVGVLTTLLAARRSGARLAQSVGTLRPSVVVGLFGLAVGLGALGRSWSGPSSLLGHLDAWGTAGLGAGASVVLNNLPAAALLSARQVTHPLALLVGLNVGPNLAVTGSLSWVLWIAAARASGASFSLSRAARIGVPAALVAMTASVAVLVASGVR